MISKRQLEHNKQYYQKNKEKILAQKREYRLTHYEEIKARERDYYERHKNERQAQKRNLREQNKQILLAEGLLTNCIICGFSKEKYDAIDWHHIDPSQKEGLMCRLTRNANKDALLKEARKCVCMCRNCHALYHANDQEVVEKYNQYMEKCDEKL